MKLTAEEETSRQIKKATACACRLLGAREYSLKQLKQKLHLKGYSTEATQAAIEFVRENGWLDERRFCESFVRAKLSRGLGLKRICYELQQNGIVQDMIHQVMENFDICWQDQCDQVAARKVANSALTAAPKDRMKLERFLTYRGFDGAEIRKSISEQLIKSGEKTCEHE